MTDTPSDQPLDPDTLAAEGFIRVASRAAIRPMLPLRVELPQRAILLCLDGDTVRAVDEMCPHNHKPMGFALVHEGRITCPHHQYVFELETGRCVNRRRCLPVETFDVRVVGDDVYVRG